MNTNQTPAQKTLAEQLAAIAKQTAAWAPAKPIAVGSGAFKGRQELPNFYLVDRNKE